MRKHRVVRPLLRVAEAYGGPLVNREAGSAGAAVDTSVREPLSADGTVNSDNAYAVLLLNSPSQIHRPFFGPLWRGASVTVCADGGATRLHRTFRTEYVPTMIAGDFDSLSTEARDTFRESGSKVIPLPDQSKNDFEKCLELLAAGTGSVDAKPLHEVYVFGGLDGRLDHTFANVGVVQKFAERFQGGIFLISGYSIATLLAPGSYEVHAYTQYEGLTCGLLPVIGPATKVTTHGLKWDITDTEISMGGYVNSSNAFAEAGPAASTSDDTAWAAAAGRHVVLIETNAPILWTTEIKDSSKNGES